MKGLALDPCNVESSQYSTQKLPQETPIIPKCITVNSKRGKDVEQFLYDGVFATLFRLNIEKSNDQNGMKKRRVQSSSISCLPYISAKGTSFEGKQSTNAFPTFIDDTDTSNCILLEQDSIDSIEESTQVKQENLVISSDYEQTTKKLVQEKLIIENLEEPKSLTIVKDPLKSSQSSRSKKEDKKKKPTPEFLRCHVGENSLRRPVIPIGPMFQANLPKWEGPHNQKPIEIIENDHHTG